MATSVACLCGSIDIPVQLDTTIDQEKLQLCHCQRCRTSVGQLYSSYHLLQNEPKLNGLQEYQESDHISRFFCKTCGAHVFAHSKPSGRFLAASGLLVAKIPVKEIVHWQLSDTNDGGLGVYLPGTESPTASCRLDVPGSSLMSKEPVTRGQVEFKEQTLHARCNCGGVEFYITKPNASSSQATSPWADLLVPYYTGSGANPEDVKWWLRDGATRYLAGTCACNTCRLSSGFPIQTWAFVPKSNILEVDGSPLDFNHGKIKRHNSSPGVCREFCSCCGATAFWHCDERPLLIDVSVGLLRAGGARAEDWLEWASDRVSFAEMAVQSDLIGKLEEVFLKMPPFQFRGNSNYRGSRPNPKHEFSFRYRPPPTAERPLLSRKREVTPDLLQGENETKAPLKFASLDALSDSGEAEMDTSDDDSDNERPRKRRAMGLDGQQENLPAPPPPPPATKWSNPDPYTVLPPPSEQTNKRVDVVKLIRKARLENAAKTETTDAVKDNSDFISLGPMTELEPENNAPENAPKGPKGQETMDSGPGNRKRTREDELKGFSRKTGKPASRYNYDGSVINEWKPRSQETGTPWFESTPSSLHIGSQLNHEILSFYNWAKPQEFESIVRMDLVERLNIAFQKRYPGVEIHAFGSFASGLYLPTADIDLVLLSNSFRRSGIRTFGERKGQIYAFSGFLKGTNIAVPNSIECIAHARVPILKFVDKLTGLHVDMSFDNNSGLIANETFQKWKAQFPEMPIILSVIKQFLLIRGLNEVPTGGLGGFSITCLVTSLLQHMPQGNLQPNLGSILMDFFNFYGKYFQYDHVAIRMDPPGYFNKIYFGSSDRLTIEDPNNPDNDISGGTREIDLILRTFAGAHTTLKNRMEYLALVQGPNKTILGPIIAGNFEEYIEQRNQLRRVFMSESRFAKYSVPPPPPEPYPLDGSSSPPPLPAGPPPPGPPPPPAQRPIKKAKSKLRGTVSEPENISSDESSGETKPNKTRKGDVRRQVCRDRAARIKRLRPDLTKLPASLSVNQALRHAGYETDAQMEHDLALREQQQAAVA
ncbi:unnamed protein product [Penicillium salamii]|nr:unnamed protein product [Penicillium salamii]CAG8171383.1 unnamed protein product [Penicillium salamii]CAG8244012.1 unnamed protein product [Penicillium salamii]